MSEPQAASQNGSETQTAFPSPFSKPILTPSPSSALPPSKPALTKEQEAKLEFLIDHFNADGLSLPGTLKDLKQYWKDQKKYGHGHGKDVSSLSTKSEGSSGVSTPADPSATTTTTTTGPGPLTDPEKMFLSKEQFLRFLRAVRWDQTKAVQRAEETIVWRREFDVEGLNEDCDRVEEEARTGKEFVLGYDMHSRPCQYMFPYRQNTKVSPRQIQFVVWILERTVDLMPAGVENLCLMIDFGSGTGNAGGPGGQPTSLGQAKSVLTILQTYYCERLGRAICVNVPYLFWAFYSLVKPFIDPVTKDKIRFISDTKETKELVPHEQLEKSGFGGDLDFQYGHKEYFYELDKVCRARRAENAERWRKNPNGPKCGISEWIIKGGGGGNEPVSVTQQEAEAANAEKEKEREIKENGYEVVP